MEYEFWRKLFQQMYKINKTVISQGTYKMAGLLPFDPSSHLNFFILITIRYQMLALYKPYRLLYTIYVYTYIHIYQCTSTCEYTLPLHDIIPLSYNFKLGRTV